MDTGPYVVSQDCNQRVISTSIRRQKNVEKVRIFRRRIDVDISTIIIWRRKNLEKALKNRRRNFDVAHWVGTYYL